METHPGVLDGLYRLVKLKEDGNPLFPSQETVVELRNGEVVNLSTGRSCPLTALGGSRALYGPIENPYDITPIDRLQQFLLGGSRPLPQESSG